MKFTLKFNGIEEVIEDLEGMFDEAKIERGLQKACLLVERSAKQKCPKDTGALRNSITSEVRGNTGIVFTPLEYAPYVEFGTGLFAANGNGRKDVPWRYKDDKGNWHTTSGQHPQPYMRPALLENREKILKILGEDLLND